MFKLNGVFMKLAFCRKLLFIISFSSCVVVAQNKDTLHLTLEDAISKALENNWDIKLSSKDVQKAQGQIDEAYANAFPRIDFQGTYLRNIKLPVLFLPPNTAFNPSSQTQTLELGSKNSYDAALTISQVLYSQKVNTAIKIAGQYADYASTGKKATDRQIILAVKKTFYTILLMKQLVEVARQNFNAALANYDNVSALYKQGAASEYDFLRSEVQAANVKPFLIQAQNNYELSMITLKNILAIDIEIPIEVEGEFKMKKIETEVMQEADAGALQNNPLVKQLRIQESLLEKNITIQRADYFPTLAFFGQYDYQTQDNTYRFNKYKWVQTFMVGLQLNYTLFDGFGRNARVQQSIIDKEKVGLGLRKLEEGLKVQIRQSEMKMEEAEKKITAQEKSLRQAEKALKIAETRYKSGVGTQLEVIDTQAAHLIAQTNYSQAIFDYLVAEADWEYAVGKNN